MYLLDTNIISEGRKRSCHANIKEWLERNPAHALHLSVITLLEVERGALLLQRKDLAQGKALLHWLHQDITPNFAGRIHPIDDDTALIAARLAVPNPRPVYDTLIAATALRHRLTLVTRNEQDFSGIDGLTVLNPFCGESD